MSRLALAILLSCSMSVFAQDFDLLSLEEFASGLSQPVGIKHAGDTSGRVFILEQSGLIKVVKNGVVNATPFLDLTGVIDNASNEQGLLGLAFHPDYVNNGYFYVNYTRDPGPGDDLTTIGRYQVSAGNPDVANTTETKILEIPQDAGNHNGGDIHFGPDGFLYIGMGDGGGSNDQFGHAQDILSLKGKMLRIDVNGSPVAGDVLCGQVQNYGIPPSNPFADVAGCDEIWSYGLRNPWRFSFDRQTGEIYIGDVGQNTWEEINLEPAATGGRNYGWSCREGQHDFASGNDCTGVSPTDPIIEYSHSPHCSVTGGYVYRGPGSMFNGYYFYGDYCSDVVWLASEGESGWTSTEWPLAAPTLNSISSFGEDEEGKLYIADRNDGRVYMVTVETLIFADSFE
ncbi:MAG: glucose dehydrogenase [Xanthomonadales bacterium]|nr:glucose dehydrogenase [Xanthomonadales bacterium]